MGLKPSCSVLTIIVVDSTRLVAQHIVRFLDLSKSFGQFTLVFVGMVFHGQFVISIFDLLGIGVSGDTQHIVVIPRRTQCEGNVHASFCSDTQWCCSRRR